MSPEGSPEVIIVGGGAVGLCIALQLARRAIRPVVLERMEDLTSGCSSGSSGLLSPGHSVPLANLGMLKEGLGHMLRRDSPFSMRPRPRLVPWLLRYMAACRSEQVTAGTEIIRALSFASLQLHEELVREGLDTSFARKGALNIYATEGGFVNGRRESVAQAAEGIESQILDEAALRDFEPAIGPAPVGGVFYPNEAHCTPKRFMGAVAEAVREAGGVIRCGVEVTGFSVTAGRITSVRTSDGDLRPGTVVLSNGAWAARFGRQLRLVIPIEGGKGYHLDYKAAATDPKMPIYIQEARVIATPMGEALRLAGTLQLSGLSMAVDNVRVRSIMAAGQRTLRKLDDTRIIEVWRGIRPCTPDGLPMIGRSERIDNLVLASGHAMKGVHLAPVTGRIVAEILEGNASGLDTSPLSPDRFQRYRPRKPAGPQSGDLNKDTSGEAASL
jgi:D-amino-acid dehydrogenase